jgi:hypothetical protein
MKRPCPACGHPAVGIWRLLALGGLRQARCAGCGAAIGPSALSYFVLCTIGTWFPVAGGVAGALAIARASPGAWAVGAILGLVFCFVLFAALYFRGARLIVT